MLIELGHVTLLLSFVLLVPVGYGHMVQQRRAFYIHWSAMVFALGVLVYAFLTHDTSVQYVASHSHADMPMYYRLMAIYGGHSGSLFLFIVMMSSWVLWYMSKAEDICEGFCKRYAWTMAGVMGLLLFLSNPFVRQHPMMSQGSGLNPLLQDMGMAIHPPILYLGYVASIVPFLWALSVRDLSKPSEVMLKVSRYALAILTVGIALGGWWAYHVLGWGGYWGWDPVENASLLPWLMQLGLYHALLAGDAKQARYLAIGGFFATIFSTGMIRSGLMVSVHSFAQNPMILLGMLVYMGLLIMMSVSASRQWLLTETPWLGLWAFRYHRQLAWGFFMLVGVTLILPMLGSFIGFPLVVGEAFFQRLMPVFSLMVLYGIGGYLSHDRYTWGVGGVVCIGSWLFFGGVLNALIVGGAAGLMVSYIRQQHWNIAHFGFLLMVIFMVLNAQQSHYEDYTLTVGQEVAFGSYAVIVQNIEDIKGQNYLEKRMSLKVGDVLLQPSVQYFPLNDTAVAQVDTRSDGFRDWYVIMGAEDNDQWSIRLYRQYWIRWIWASVALMVYGVLRKRVVV